MKLVIQRVSRASVTVRGKVTGRIGRGFLVLVGVGREDTREDADRLIKKMIGLRIFADENGKTNLSLKDVDGQLLLVSQFTLYADCSHGNRPGFTNAGDPTRAEELYEYMLERCRQQLPVVEKGEFGADMQVELVNDGPFTILLDSDSGYNKEFEELVESNRYLYGNTLNRQDVDEMLQYFSRMMGNPVAVFDGMFHCLYSTDELFQNMRLLRTLPKTIYTGSPHLNRHYVRQRVALKVDGQEQEYFMISFPVSFQGKIRAYLSIPQIYQEVKNLNSPLAEVTASAIMGQLKHNFALRFAEEKNIDSFFYNAICRKHRETEELKQQARVLGYTVGQRLSVVVMDAACSGDIEDSPQLINHMSLYSADDKIFLIIDANVKKMKYHALTGRLDGRILVLCEAEASEIECIQELKDCFRRIREEFRMYFKESRLQAGIGNSTELSELAESCSNAEKALTYGQLIYGKSSFVTAYDDAFLLQLMGSIPDRKNLLKLIPEGLFRLDEYDRNHNSELLSTLFIYFNNGGHMRKSAEEMMIHYKTMSYRMNQIMELCETDFSDSIIFLQYALGIKIYFLLKNSIDER